MDREFMPHFELQVWTRLQGWQRNVRCSVMPERQQPAQHCVDVGSRNEERRMKVPDTINGFEVHKPLDALLEEPDPYFAPPPRLVATDIMNDPILNALADNFQGIRDAEQLRVNQQQLNLAVSQAAVNQGISQETLEKLLSRVSEQHGERFAQRLLDRLVVSGGPPPGPPPSGGVAVSRETQSTPETRSTGAGPGGGSRRSVPEWPPPPDLQAWSGPHASVPQPAEPSFLRGGGQRADASDPCRKRSAASARPAKWTSAKGGTSSA
jgi:hypothetical protein